MMNFYKKNAKNKISKKKNNFFAKKEHFSAILDIYTQTQYSKKLTYFTFNKQKKNFFLSNIKNKCIDYKFTKNILKRFRLSRYSITRKLSNGHLPGFYFSQW